MTVGGEQDRESESGEKKSQKQHGKKPGEEKHPENCALDWLANHNNHPKIKRTGKKKKPLYSWDLK